MNEADITAALQQPSPGKGRRGRANQQNKGGAATPEKQAASELLGHSDSLSARERNKLKRKAKALERQSSVRLDSRGRVSKHGRLDQGRWLRDTHMGPCSASNGGGILEADKARVGLPQKRTDTNTSCVLQVAELLAEQRSNNARETSPGRGAQSPTAAAAAAVAAAGAAAVLSDEQAAEQDLEEVGGRAVVVGPAGFLQSTHHVAAGCAYSAWGFSTVTSLWLESTWAALAAGGCHWWCVLKECFCVCCCSGTAWSLGAGPSSALQTSCAVTC